MLVTRIYIYCICHVCRHLPMYWSSGWRVNSVPQPPQKQLDVPMLPSVYELSWNTLLHRAILQYRNPPPRPQQKLVPFLHLEFWVSMWLLPAPTWTFGTHQLRFATDPREPNLNPFLRSATFRHRVSRPRAFLKYATCSLLRCRVFLD